MKSNAKLLYTFLALMGVALVATKPVSAETCTTQYGGQYGTTTTCVPADIFVNKKVQHPSDSGVYLENLMSDNPYSVNSDVLYQITVTNAGSETVGTVTVEDTLPSELTFISGPGTYANGTLTFTLSDMKAGETRTEYVLARVKPANELPKADITCDVRNTVKVTADDRTDEDTADLCIQTKVLGATTLPVAGFNDMALLVPFAITGLGGLLIAKKRS